MERSLFFVPRRSGLRKNHEIWFGAELPVAGSFLVTSAAFHLDADSRQVAIPYAVVTEVLAEPAGTDGPDLVISWVGGWVRVRFLRIVQDAREAAIRCLRRWVLACATGVNRGVAPKAAGTR
ncbi:MAG: hypothetical protein AAB215_10035 [Planctomycetota bacterium]